ncbi:MAG: hypothetical protein K6G47_06235 [Clostridia bacterium]|nr:hypothetical protein [Clostridia bacterium]
MSSNDSSRDNKNIESSGDDIIVRQVVTPPLRPRKDQPTGFHGNKPSLFLRSVNHDYLYYPMEWVDKETGKLYKKGYYDENGEYYESVVIQKDKHYETTVACSFCGTEIRLSWEEGDLPSCPNCGAALHDTFGKALYEDEIEDTIKKVRIPKPNPDKKARPKPPSEEDSSPIFRETEKYHPILEKTKPALGIILPIIAVALFFVVIFVIDSAVNKKDNGYIERSTWDVSYDYTPKPTPIPGYCTKFYTKDDLNESYYVRTLGRMCYLDEFGRYYDEETGCYFWYDPEQDPPSVVYEFDGISNEFGSYGLMKYDYDEGRWYIEASYDNWIHLPDKYDESALWHLPKPNEGKYNGKSSVYVYAIGRECNYIESEKNYYDPETKCHFYYNDLFGNKFWVYWFEDFYEEEGIGWLRYSKSEDAWYTENQTRWFKLKDGTYDFSKYCWHMDGNPV